MNSGVYVTNEGVVKNKIPIVGVIGLGERKMQDKSQNSKQNAIKFIWLFFRA